MWDRLAPAVCHPLVARLKPHMTASFVLMCEALVQYETYVADLKVIGEVYESTTRNGVQFKARPEVAQRNDAFRRFLTIARDFGLTPASERGIQTAGNQGNLFDAGDGDFA